MQTFSLIKSAIILIAAYGCQPDMGSVDGEGDSVQSNQQFLELTPLDVEARVHRLSFSIRGIPASASDIARVTSDASQLESLADDYLASSHFRDTVKDMFSEIFLTRSEPVFPLLGDLAPSTLPDVSWTTEQLKTFGQFGLAREIGEGPLELIASIAVAEPARPFSEIVTADHTYLGSVSRSVWSMGDSYDPAGAPGFQAVEYTDGRPSAGLLSDPTIMRRWFSQGGNYQRGRANMVADAFLCASFAERDVALSTDIDFGDAAQVSDAVMTDDSCVACHQGLDPIGAVFWPYMGYFTPAGIRNAHEDGRCEQQGFNLCYPLQTYNPSPAAAQVYKRLGLRDPAFYGKPITTTADLGREIAADPRFSRCMARRVYGFVTQIDPKRVPTDVAYDLQQVFIESNLSFKALFKAAALHPRNLAADSDEAEAIDIGRRSVRAEFFVRTLKHLTGFNFGVAILINCQGPRSDSCPGYTDLAADAVFGMRGLLGGTDGVRVLQPVFPTTVTKVLSMNTLAQLAAAQAYYRELEPGADKSLFAPWDGTEGTIDTQIVHLWQTILGDDIDAETAQSLRQVFDEIVGLATSVNRQDPQADAWIGVLAVIMQDPSLTLY